VFSVSYEQNVDTKYSVTLVFGGIKKPSTVSHDYFALNGDRG